MTERTKKLRDRSIQAVESISGERARLITEFYRENDGNHSVPVMRALAFKHLCLTKTVYIGADELIVGERGPEPKATPTYPELTCHTLRDLGTLHDRERTSYKVSEKTIRLYDEEVIPFWTGRN